MGPREETDLVLARNWVVRREHDLLRDLESASPATLVDRGRRDTALLAGFHVVLGGEPFDATSSPGSGRERRPVNPSAEGKPFFKRDYCGQRNNARTRDQDFSEPLVASLRLRH